MSGAPPARAERERAAGSPEPHAGGDGFAPADLRACIHCGLCLQACPTYRTLRLEPGSPRGRIHLMRAFADARLAPEHPLLEYLDQCLGCRACQTACPAGVPYGRLLTQARGQLEPLRPERSLSRRLGHWALERLVPDRAAMHRAADLVRLLQRSPVAAFMRSRAAARLLPEFAVRGWRMTPPLLPRRERTLERVAPALPAGARLEERADALVFHPAGPARVRVAFFPACVMEVMFPRIDQQAVRLLVLAGCEVTVPRARPCCGALQAHAGMRGLARDLARANARLLATLDCDLLVSDSAGCGAALREADELLPGDPEAARLAASVRDVAEVLAEVGLPEPAAPLGSAREGGRPLRVAYHDPCHLAHAQGVRRPPRDLLRRLPGVELADLPDSDWCCGSAGVYDLSHPAMSDAQLAHKVDTIAAVSPEVVVASNPGCAMHMARGAAERGLAVRIEHLVELLARAYPPPATPR
jgi:Fe-S oxidoreductase